MAVLKRRHRLARLLFLCLVFLLSSVEMAQNDVGDLVIVKGGPMTLYTRPATGTRLTEMPDNTVTEIVAGPEIVDGMRWWYVSNNFAWVAEKDSLDGELLPYDPAILEQSIAAATVILDNDPDNVEALFRRGWAYFNLQNYEQATEDLSAAIAQDPENTALYLASGKINLDAGHYTDAIRDLTHALALDPNDLAALNRRGVAYQSFDDYQSASLDYLTAHSLHLNMACCTTILATSLESMKISTWH